MTKTKLRALERIWLAEIEGRLPLQSKASIFDQLHDEGYVSFDRIQRGPVIISGWYLTHAGRLSYCLSCGSEEAA